MAAWTFVFIIIRTIGCYCDKTRKFKLNALDLNTLQQIDIFFSICVGNVKGLRQLSDKLSEIM